MINLEEAKNMMTQDSWEKLDKIVKPSSNNLLDNNKNIINNDVLMAAYCNAIKGGVISMKVIASKPMISKLYNSQTNKLSDRKIENILSNIHEYQPKMACVITVQTGKFELVKEFIYVNKVNFHPLFKWVVEHFQITPQMVRENMVKKLDIPISTTNNIGQYLSKIDDPDANVSITTISRLINMCDHIIKAEFKEID